MEENGVKEWKISSLSLSSFDPLSLDWEHSEKIPVFHQRG
jgi:hypothetical protein